MAVTRDKTENVLKSEENVMHAIASGLPLGQVRSPIQRAQALFFRLKTGLGDKGQFSLICSFLT